MLDVFFDKRMGVMLALFPLMAINQTSLEVILTSLSFYFILYGVVETLFAYSKNRNPNTLLIACGLAVIAGGWWISLVSPDGLMLNIVQLLDEGSWTSHTIHPRAEVIRSLRRVGGMAQYRTQTKIIADILVTARDMNTAGDGVGHHDPAEEGQRLLQQDDQAHRRPRRARACSKNSPWRRTQSTR